MTAFIDFFSVYILSVAETLIEFHFFTKFVGKNPKIYHYVIFYVISNTMVNLLPAVPFLKFAFYVLLLLLYGILVMKTNSKITILYAFITVEIMQLCYGISKSFIGILSPILYSFNPNAMSVFFMAVSNFMALLLSYLCYYIVRKYFTCSETEQNQYVLMILIPLLLIFMSSEYINNTVYSNTIVLSRNGAMLNANHFQMLAMQIFGIFSLFCIVYAYQKLVISFQVNKKLSMLEQEAHFQNQYVTEAKSRYEKTKSFRHDMKNHLSVIHGFLTKGNITEAEKYLQSVETLTNDLSFPCHTNNPVLDILLENKLGLAQNSGITASCSLEVPYPCPINDTDFCIILSNALDNAIHACEKITDNSQKWIQVIGRRQGDFFLIEVRNSYNEKRLSKKGIGLSNMKAITEKYNGAMSTGRQNGVFCLSVLLIIPQHSASILQQIY